MEYPNTVNIAAMNAWSTSSENGRIVYNNEKMPRITMASCPNAITAPKPYCHLVNLTRI